MVLRTNTQYWNDSCSLVELRYAIARGATGATTNPVIVNTVLSKEFSTYQATLKKALKDYPNAGEDDIAWLLIEYAAIQGAKLLEKKFDPKKGTGRISIQTNTKYYKNTEKLVQQGLHFHSLAKNMQVKIPATEAGICAAEELTYQGVNINATVSFTVPQSLAIAEAVERALDRREKEGKSNAAIQPVCTIMVGRLDDWLKAYTSQEGIILDPECLEWAGVAVFKRAYEIYKEKGYRSKLLAAAYRNHYHWSEFIGGDVIETIPYAWQVKFNNSTIAVQNRMSTPVDSGIVKQLTQKVPDFKKAYEPKGLTERQFNSYGATKRTLLQFAQGYDELVRFIRGYMIEV
ncbi:transaldolase-like [Ylistrum balloti]|uniref:transaldolase-like n=1 Tax=Ylistrum balloti TaxID=509963 RepID=UPI002905B77B|nr:transaldolase-like [Ylistrum balloti]